MEVPMRFIPILCLMIFLTSSLQAVFFLGERFINKQGNIIECFGDIHLPCDKSRVATMQQDQIIDLARAKNSCVIVEDMNARYSANENISQYQVDTMVDTPLDNLSTRCADESIECYNLEFREESAASLGGFPIAAHETLNPFHATAHEILNYRDCAFLNAYYWKTLSSVFNENILLLQELKKVNCSLQDYCHDANEQKRTRINLFDAPLLDARIIHTIYNNRLKPHITVCAGANHIDRIKPILSKLGYKSIGRVQKDIVLLKENLIDCCSALSINEYCQENKNIHELRAYISRIFMNGVCYEI